MDIASVDYIPAWRGNRDEDKPFTVTIIPMSRGDIERYAEAIHSEPVRGFRNRMKNNAGAIQRKQFMDHVEKIDGLVHPRLQSPITTAKDLYDAPGMNNLITEIIEAMEDESTLDEGLEKN